MPEEKDEIVISAGLEQARENLVITSERVQSIRDKFELDIEFYERTAEDLRDQASCYAEAAQIIRSFIYGENSGSIKAKIAVERKHG